MTKKDHDSDVAFIQALAELLRENDLTELEVKREYGEADRLNVRVSRGGGVVTQMVAPSYAPSYAPAPAHAPSAAPAPAASASDDPADHPGAVTSPMVGTVYMQSEPGAPAFIKIGDKVAEGDTLLIVPGASGLGHV